MLRSAAPSQPEGKIAPSVRVSDARFPSPFHIGLEFAPPARGMWNIVQIGFLIPEAHEIFVCARGCLRGVVLTAAEMGESARMSTVSVEEENLLDGDMEELIIEGVSDVLARLPNLPPAVLVYTSCVHHFTGCDLPMCYAELRRRFPGTDFTDCYMTPIMRKSGLTPDQTMRRQLYSLLAPTPRDSRTVSLVGNCLPTFRDGDLPRLALENGFILRDVTECESYDEYLRMAESFLFVSYLPAAKAGGDALAERLGARHIHLPISYSPEKIRENMARFAEALGAGYDGGRDDEARAMEKLSKARDEAGEMAIAIDYTATPRPLGLARLLAERGFDVRKIFADSFSPDERDDFDWLASHVPDLSLSPTSGAEMRTERGGSAMENDENFLAIGQKAAYFTDSEHFVNMIEGGGMYGFGGIFRLAGMMISAAREPRDTRALIERKGLGCQCLL
jgi:hypothetical protein